MSTRDAVSNPNDDEVVRRQNNAFNSGEMLAKLVYPLASGGTLALLNDFRNADEGELGEALRPLYLDYLGEHDDD